MEHEYGMMSLDEVRRYLAEVEDQLDPGYLRELNGGILLVSETLRSEHDRGGNLFTLGMYHYEPRGLGRYITIYYGTFALICRGKSQEEQKKSLKDVLLHELQHHLESLSGDRSLEREDQEFLRRYYRGEKTERG